MAALDTAAVAGLIADALRVAMLDLLLDGREHSASELARAAAVAPSTGSEHLGRLEQGGIVRSRARGPQAPRAPREPGRRGRLRSARAALAGERGAGSAGLDAARAAARGADLLRPPRRPARRRDRRRGAGGGSARRRLLPRPSAPAWFARLGVDLEALPHGRRPLLRVCTDWTERREHLAGALGAAVCAAVIDAGWAARRPSSRALQVTPLGRARLQELGIAVA